MSPKPQAPAPVARQSTHGPVNAVPCPHCGHKNDCRLLDEQSLLDMGHRLSCDKCNRMFVVVNIQSVKVISVKQIPGVAPRRTS